MPLDRFVSLVLGVIAAAGLTVLVLALAQGGRHAAEVGLGLWAAGGIVPLALIAGLVLRVALEQRRRRDAARDRARRC